MLKLFSQKLFIGSLVYSLLCLSSFQAEAVRNCREQFLLGDDKFLETRMVNALIEDSKKHNDRLFTIARDYYEIVGLLPPEPVMGGLVATLGILNPIVGENEAAPDHLKGRLDYLIKEIQQINNLIHFQESECEYENIIDQVKCMQTKLGLTQPIKGSLFRQVEQLRNDAESKIHLFTLIASAMEKAAEENR